MPSTKRENSVGLRLYKRSQAIDYAAFRLMELFSVPAFVLDWPSDKNGYLIFNKQGKYNKFVTILTLNCRFK